MRVLLTGFTTKSYHGKPGPLSHGITELITSCIPQVLDDLQVKYFFVPDLPPNTDLSTFDHYFIKIWALDESSKRYTKHVPVLIDRLRNINWNKVTLIDDHWDQYKAIKSINEKMWGQYSVWMKELENKWDSRLIQVVHPKANNEVDPTVYYDMKARTKFQSARWIAASLSGYEKEKDNANFLVHKELPMDQFTDLHEKELIDKIARHGLAYIDPHENMMANWWRVRYQIAMSNGAAVYATRRESESIFNGVYFPVQTIEAYREDVARLQSDIWWNGIEPKSSIQAKIARMLENVPF